MRILQGEAEAQCIQSANTQLANELQYIQYILSSKWNGTPPGVLIMDVKSTLLLQRPTTPITPTLSPTVTGTPQTSSPQP